ncbi:(2S)-3-sulfopropanediol dehydratase activating enzyme [Desulfovibrio intestinalis]|uniref:Pyruvate formate lyase activating enzyme n=1 Tax=Desulfovibrio intestinalis TaxID=58621 RepID=A0A7W8C0U9_9BACT|nr:glycyl-radical enzyme activating protein [Desulfovibrio intestinalis]MBB5143516.1 pyruvate formate lyase activating enzyme [Desulfovibrio intestinalis]
MTDAQVKGTVFNIQKFSVHDGEGIRTLVFLKGCPLHCLWCSNPESQNIKPEHAFNPSRCLSAQVCGRCLKVCPSGALGLVEGIILHDRSRCTECMACVHACPSGAQSIYGESMSVEQVLNKVEEDGVFYHRSGGGMTLSGGEALTQHKFAHALLREGKRHHINTTIETCGCYPYGHLYEACKHLDKLIFDIKSLNPVKHKEFTGVDNALILKNFTAICEDFPYLPILVRTPVVPGFNDSDDDILAIREFIPRRPNIEYELLTYHRMGQPKYSYLGRRYELDDVKADEARMERLRELAQ